ncbi:MAG: TRAP transporter large permease subunit [Elusimicrobiota bacterium]|jgi:tripartite ATP-independent transporter DctM subunit|nr:TRAP transporter large permease subunit [Elusimicrobiota bacterium]
MIIAIFLLCLIGAIIVGVPIAISILFSALGLMIYLGDFNTQYFALHLMRGTDVPALMALPFFILAGEFMNRGGLTNRIVEFANVFVGRLRGGLGYVTIIACLIFAALVGSAVASTAALGAILIPMMTKAGYTRNRTTALVAGANIVAPIMPPSVPMIIFGVTAGVSISKLFMAGIAPAVYISVGLSVLWFFISKKETGVAKQEKLTLKQAVKSVFSGFWAILMPVIIIVGMRGGIFTPTEAGVVAAVYALLVGIIVYRELTFKEIIAALIATAKMTSVIMLLAAAATVAAYLMTIGQIPLMITKSLSGFVANPLLLKLMIVLFVILLGTSMDVVPIVLILTPIFMPLVRAAGIDPVYFGLIFIITTVFGLMTPPVGNVLNVACGTAKIKMEDLLGPILPYLIVEITILLLMVFFPQLVTVPLSWFTGGGAAAG